jgi:hypothetical protein
MSSVLCRQRRLGAGLAFRPHQTEAIPFAYRGRCRSLALRLRRTRQGRRVSKRLVRAVGFLRVPHDDDQDDRLCHGVGAPGFTDIGGYYLRRDDNTTPERRQKLQPV